MAVFGNSVWWLMLFPIVKCALAWLNNIYIMHMGFRIIKWLTNNNKGITERGSKGWINKVCIYEQASSRSWPFFVDGVQWEPETNMGKLLAIESDITRRIVGRKNPQHMLQMREKTWWIKHLLFWKWYYMAHRQNMFLPNNNSTTMSVHADSCCSRHFVDHLWSHAPV